MSRKVSIYLLAVFLVVGCFIGLLYATVPEDTLRTTATGISTMVVDYINATRGYYIGDQNVTVTLKYPGRSGIVTTCSNGTWIAHGLDGNPGLNGTITLSLRGPSAYNATFILRVPTVLSSNTTHFQVEFLAWETGTWTLVPVTTAEAQTIYWYAVYNPP